MSLRPPRLIEAVLTWCLRSHAAAEPIVGDLGQEFCDRAREGSRVRASIWYLWHALAIGLPYLASSGREALGSARAAGVDLLWRDVAGAVRSLARAPFFAATVVLTIAIGIGANASMFGVVDRVLLSAPPHTTEADELRLVSTEGFGSRSAVSPQAYSFPDYLAIRDNPVLVGAAAYRVPRRWTMGTGEAARRVLVQQATASYFPLLGVHPELGRFYTDEEDRPGAALTAVLSHGFWLREFGGRASVLGETLHLNRGRYTIVGVAPESFTGAELRAVDVWAPAEASVAAEGQAANLESRKSWWWRTVVRLSKGVEDEAAEARLTAAHRAGVLSAIEAGESVSRADGGQGALRLSSIVTAVGPNASTASSMSIWLGALSILVLLISCANVVNLILVRGIEERQSRAVHAALGAGAGRLAVRSMLEVGLLVGAGTAAAWLLAQWTGTAIQSLLLPELNGVRLDDHRRLAAFLAVVGIAATAAAGVVPALQAARTAPGDVLRGAGRGNSGSREGLRAALTFAQISLSLILLAGAGLAMKSLSQASAVDLGFDPEGVVTASLQPAEGVTRARRAELYWEIAERLRGAPFVEAASVASGTVPLAGWQGHPSFRISGGDSLPTVEGGGPYIYGGTEGFVEAVGMRVIAGRAFVPSDYAAGAPLVAMVSASFAEAAWPGGDPLRECVAQYEDPSCRPVVGVYADLAVRALNDQGLVSAAVPEPPRVERVAGLIVRARGDLSLASSEITDLFHEVAGEEIRFASIFTSESRVERLIGPWRAGATIFLSFGVVALLVASLGLYSVLAFGVASRRREFGIRAALGAEKAGLMWMTLGRAIRFLALGIGCGAAVVVASGGVVESFLFRVQVTDPLVLGGAAATLTLAGVLAALVPAWRATTTPPASTLRGE